MLLGWYFYSFFPIFFYCSTNIYLCVVISISLCVLFNVERPTPSTDLVLNKIDKKVSSEGKQVKQSEEILCNFCRKSY